MVWLIIIFVCVSAVSLLLARRYQKKWLEKDTYEQNVFFINLLKAIFCYILNDFLYAGKQCNLIFCILKYSRRSYGNYVETVKFFFYNDGVFLIICNDKTSSQSLLT